MKQPRLSNDLVPVHEFRANLATWLDQPMKTGRPVILTQRGKAAAVLVSPAMLDELEDRRAVVTEVIEGLSEVAAGELVEDEEVWAEVDQRLATLRSDGTRRSA